MMYAVSPSQQEAEKHRRAQELLEHDDLTLSVQVLQECYYQETRPDRTDPLTDCISDETKRSRYGVGHHRLRLQSR